MIDIKDLLGRKKRTGDWNVGTVHTHEYSNDMLVLDDSYNIYNEVDEMTEIRKVETYKAELDAAMNRVNQLTGAGFCYARALDTAAAEYNLPAEDLEQHIDYYTKQRLNEVTTL